jgi:hypothetical protein
LNPTAHKFSTPDVTRANSAKVTEQSIAPNNSS